MGTIRSFVAIPLGAEVISCLEKIHKELKALPADVKWVRPGSIHLTLKFLGNIEEEDIGRITQAIEQGKSGFEPWSIFVRNVGAFPSLGNPRVVWIGIEDKTSQILPLQQSIERELSRLGFEKEERKFFPHLTLGRIRSPRGKRELIQYLTEERERTFGEVRVDRIVLFKSELRPSGAIYTALREFPF